MTIILIKLDHEFIIVVYVIFLEDNASLYSQIPINPFYNPHTLFYQTLINRLFVIQLWPKKRTKLIYNIICYVWNKDPIFGNDNANDYVTC